ncbi:MAG: prepilin peptidase [Acaryochloridaceae cyanobacterium SU_2_1]|nr:prepilin peptidase [Acaryochloridaceae cyanobacterium SU_2_1]
MDGSAFLIYGLVISFGAAIGSFLNVVIYRLPAGLSVLWPPSRCPDCHTQLRIYDNVPILGWLWLRGRCRYCQTTISPRYPLVEALTAGLFLLVFLIFGYQLQTLGYWLFVSLLISLALIDLDVMLLPNPLTQTGVITGLLFQGALGWLINQQPAGLAEGLITGFLGAVIGIWLFDLIGFAGSLALKQTAMGGGDGKLAAMIGAWLGWPLLLLSTFLACFAGAVIGGGGILLGLIGRRQPIPFGPYLVLGALLSLFVGESMLSAYRQWVGL